MLTELTAYEIDLYAKFYEQEPWGFEVWQTGLAQLQASIYNASGHVKKPLTWRDFMPQQDGALTPDKLKAMLDGD